MVVTFSITRSLNKIMIQPCISIFSAAYFFGIIYHFSARGIRQNITLCDGNIIAEGNILLNPPRSGSINNKYYNNNLHTTIPVHENYNILEIIFNYTGRKDQLK